MSIHTLARIARHIHKGAFTANAEKAGVPTQEYAHEEEHAKGKLGKEARLDLTFAKHRPK